MVRSDLALVFVLLLQSGWSIYRGDRGLGGVAEGELKTPLELQWTYATEAAIASSPVIAEGRAYVGSDDGHVHCMDLQSGEPIWAFPTDDMIEAPPLVLDGKVYIGSSDFFFYALDALTGELQWKYETDDKILGGANWLEGPDGKKRVVVGSYDTHLYCFDAISGDKLWAYQTDNFVHGTPAVEGNHIAFGGCDAVLHRVDLDGNGKDSIALGDGCHIAGSIALKPGEAYLGHYGNEFVCLDLNTQKPRWVYRSERHPFYASPAITPDQVVFGGRDKRMHCVRRDNGEELWEFQTRRKVDGSPVICDGKVVFGSGDGRLYVLSLDKGEELWSFEIGQSIFSSPALADGKILIGCNDGKIYAFGTGKRAEDEG
jgi:outer membrane protein assembly factor BamB